ncbi:MAG: bifunctional nuclease family protein [Candidatus Auribacterota bacterium]|jgi:bifunctional DNase/RNase|uniref:Bifunctional nuclease family protein n=1 Tax=Candidatus Auribacter fodinae TaxID=2093366 RepID=A0A3A4RAQ2_9BACT|nr:MAG: bifunctional nuclease family protein [Candidatus Auribacter fodinae]
MQEHNKARVYTVMMVPVTGQFVVLLEEVDGTRLLPIWIGRAEGESILIKLQNVTLPRPITHDLTANILETFNAKLTRVEVTDLRDNTYFAELTIEHNSKKIVLDSRPSDAIALALRTGSEIYISQKVLEKCPVVSKPISQEEVDDFKDQLERLDPSEFFKDLGNIEES